METKYTAGPWEVRTNPRNQDDFFVQAKRNHPDHPYDIEIMGDDHGSPLYPTEQRRADAALISAAPDLLDVAHMEEAQDLPYNEGVKILEGYGWQKGDNVKEFIQAKRRSAIAKAEGR